MKQIHAIVQNIGELIKNSEDQIIEQIKNHEIQNETTTTDRFLGTIVNEINQHGLDHSFPEGLVIQATTLTDRGPNTQESRLGADFSIILDIDVENFRLRKGVLFQAKNAGNGIRTRNPGGRVRTVSFTNTRLDELRPQVENMFTVTPDNFVIIYDTKGFQVVPGNSILGLTQGDTVYAKPISNFFKEFLMCFIGDPKLTSTNPSEWNIEDGKISIRTSLEIIVKEKGL